MNIVLIGMPGCGKSTIGVILAKTMLCDFIDTDLLIQNRYKKSLSSIIDEEGLDEFKLKENSVLKNLHTENSVIATGGSAVYCKEGMENLKKDGQIIYLKLSPEIIRKRINNITTRGIAMEKGTTIEELYREREALYNTYADFTIECEGLSVEKAVEEIMRIVICKKRERL